MKRFFSLISVFLLIFAVAACGGKKKNEEKPAYEEQITQEVSAEEGGTVKNSDESVSIEITSPLTPLHWRRVEKGVSFL